MIFIKEREFSLYFFQINFKDIDFLIDFLINRCEAVYGRVVDVAISMHWMYSKDYYIELCFLEALNCKVLWREFWEWKLCNIKIR